MAARSLDIWLYGELVAQVTERRTGSFQLRYTDAALDRWAVGRPLLSVSMPLAPSPYPPGIVGPFLDGLLPEGDARLLLEDRYDVRRGDAAGLLAQIGRDCAGAVVVMPAGQPPPTRVATGEPLDHGSLTASLRTLAERPLGDDAAVRVSLAGQQSKLLLARAPDGAWFRPLGGTPSTHILKPADQRYPHVAANEVLCLRLARELGLTEVEAELLEVDGLSVVVVSRYDRQLRDGRVERLHQEDICQALAIDIGPRGAGKYQGSGGPSFADVARLLEIHNGDPQETARLVEVATFTVLIGNADAHGKNLSLLLPAGGRVQLAPLYDVMSTVSYPDVAGPLGTVPVSTELAMFVNGKRQIDAVDALDLHAEARRWHLADDVDEPIERILERFDTALEAAAAGLPQAPDQLVDHLRARASRFRGGSPTGVPSRG